MVQPIEIDTADEYAYVCAAATSPIEIILCMQIKLQIANNVIKKSLNKTALSTNQSHEYEL